MPVSPVAPEFTTRDLNRQPGRVLEACDRLGFIRIRSRKGQTYELRPQQLAEETKPAHPEFATRRKVLGMPEMTKRRSKKIDKLISGE